jgi:dTDP-glucose 4,6-dehydratase
MANSQHINGLVLVTGGMGFIGSNFITYLLNHGDCAVVNLDIVNYAANPSNLALFADDPRHIFVHADVVDGQILGQILERYQPLTIVNFAAETHVDRSILEPSAFIHSNIVGTAKLLEETLQYWCRLSDCERRAFRFLQISTDEVYGDLGLDESRFDEDSRLLPNNPYAASKAAADLMVRAYHKTYGLPTIITRSSNNYGPSQHPEKLIPFMISNALKGTTMPIYGDGSHIRNWLYVEDHCAAIEAALIAGTPGEVYNIANNDDPECNNLELVRLLCSVLDELLPSRSGKYARLITHVADRPGHDRRYAMKTEKIERELGWRRRENIITGIRKTVRWYLNDAS